MSVVPIDSARSPLAYALRYAGIGAHVFPCWWIAEDGKCACRSDKCKSPGKHPIPMLTPKGQHDATTDPATIRRWWQQMPKANVAIFLQPTRWVAVDIDPRSGGYETIERLEGKHGPLESDVLQYSGGGGEHRVFLAPADIGSLPGSLGAGIDLKHNGYIIAEPSNHISGRQYAWEASSDPLEGAIPSPLPDWLRNLSMTPAAPTVSAVVRPITQQEFDDAMAALSAICSDDRETWLQVGMALHSTGYEQAAFSAWDAWSQTSTKYDPVDQTRTWRSFRHKGIAGVSKATIFALAQRAGWFNAPALPAPVPVETITIAEPAPVTLPRLDAPGALGEAAAWVLASAIKPNPQYAMAAAITWASTVLGRRVVSNRRNWPSLYLLVIGVSGSGKEHIKWAVEQLLEASSLAHLIGPSSYTSDSGLLSALLRQPSHVTVIDEFGKVLEAASVKGAARAQSTMRALMEAWGRCDGVMRPQGFSTFGMSQRDADDLAAKSIRNPALSLVGMTTPDSFFDSIGSAAARDGFLNRFLVIEDITGRQMADDREAVDVPAGLAEWAQSARHVDGLINPDSNAGMGATPRVVPFSAASHELLRAFERDCVSRMDALEDAGLAEMYGRTREIAMRLALIGACASDASQIEADVATWAVDYVRHYTEATIERMKNSVADTDFEAACQQVFSCVQRAGKEGRTEREIMDRSRRFRGMRPRERAEVLLSLSQSGQMAQTKREQLYPLRTTPVWVAITDAADKAQT
jgi:hypothetical protein